MYEWIVLCALLANGYFDYRSRKIYEMIYIGAFFCGMALSSTPLICFTAALVFLFFDEKRGSQFPIGFGDMETLVLIWTAAGLGLGFIAFITLIISVFWAAATKCKSVPLVTFLAVGYTVWFVLQMIIF